MIMVAGEIIAKTREISATITLIAGMTGGTSIRIIDKLRAIAGSSGAIFVMEIMRQPDRSERSCETSIVTCIANAAMSAMTLGTSGTIAVTSDGIVVTGVKN